MIAAHFLRDSAIDVLPPHAVRQTTPRMKKNPVASPQPTIALRFPGTVAMRAAALAAALLAPAFPPTRVAAQEAVVEAPVDPLDREVDFIHFLMDEKLMAYAELAVQELRSSQPSQLPRIEVVQAALLLRQGRTAPVEEMLAGKNLASDTKAQAILLQLGSTYDALGKAEDAKTKYRQFLALNEGKDITDPDVLRYFASAALRLGALLQEAGDFDGAAAAYAKVVASSKNDTLKRKFMILATQNRLDQAFRLQGAEREGRVAGALELSKDILFGANDNYWFMAMGLRAWGEHLRGKTPEALKSLADLTARSAALETEMDKIEGIPKSEYPRAMLRFIQGEIFFEGAKATHAAGDAAKSKEFVGQAAGQLYTAFLNYEGNEYARRAGLRFEELKAWVKETFNIDLAQSTAATPQTTALAFKRQLDLSAELLRTGKTAEAEDNLLKALRAYPITPHTVSALDILSKVWLDQGQLWEAMALAEYLAQMFPDDPDAANVLLRVGKRFFDDKNVFGYETIFGAFGRQFPGNPRAPALLVELARQAGARGDLARAKEFNDEVVRLYPGSKFTTQVLTQQAVEALNAKNWPLAIELFGKVKDQAPPGFQRAQATLGLADAKLKSGVATSEKEAVEELVALRKELAPAANSIYYRGDDAPRSEKLLRDVRFLLSQILLAKARAESSAELRGMAEAELSSYLVDYPDGDKSPAVMYSLGRLLLQQGKTEGAIELFNRLGRDYPESEEGKDALYTLVKAALDENMVEVAQESVRKMLAQPEAYDIAKIFRVGQLMLTYERWQEAFDCFAITLRHPSAATDAALKQRALYSQGMASLGLKRPQAAIDAFGTLVKDFPKSSLVVDAGIALSQSHLQVDPPNLPAAEEALQAVGRILNSLTGTAAKVGRTQVDVALGQIALAKEDSKTALAAFYRAGLQRPETPEHGDIVRKALRLGIAEAQRLAQAGDAKLWSLVTEFADQFVRNFPMDKDAADMRALYVKALGLTP